MRSVIACGDVEFVANCAVSFRRLTTSADDSANWEWTWFSSADDSANWDWRLASSASSARWTYACSLMNSATVCGS
jgi:hypothetical protein